MFNKIFDKVYTVSLDGSGKFPSSFCIYFDDEIKTLLDTPLNTEFANLFTNKRVDMIINSHFHRDHSGCNHLFENSKVLAHSADIPAMQSLEVFEHYYGVGTYASREEANSFLSWINYKPSPIHGEINDGDIIDLGSTKLEVIHTPGHTPGHCAFLWREKGVLFTADIDLTSFGPWYGNAVSDVDQVINSIEKMIEINPDIVVTGHKGIISKNATSELRKYLDIVYEKEEKILSALRKPKTIHELTNEKIIYGRWYDPLIMFQFFERLSLIVHLRRLIRLGLVVKDKDYFITNSKSQTFKKTIPGV